MSGPDVFFADCFGLTRVDADGEVRTAPELSGTVLSIDTGARFGLLHKSRGVRVIVDLARMSEIGALDSGEQMHPAGAVLTPVGPPYAFRVALLNEDGAAADDGPRDLGGENAPERGVLRLAGGDSIDLVCFETPALDAAGNYIAWFSYAGKFEAEMPASVLCAGRFPSPEGPATPSWRQEFRGQESGRLSLSIAGGVPVVFLRHPTTAKVDVAIFDMDHDAAPVRQRTIHSLTPPTRVGQALVYQPDAATVVREPLEYSAPIQYPLFGKHVGHGRVVARGDRWLFVPAHGESVLDLESGAELDRGLPVAGAKARAAAVAAIAKLTTVLSDAGMDARMVSGPVGQSTTTDIELSGGGPFLGPALQETADEVLRRAGLDTGFLFSMGAGGDLTGPVTRAEMVDFLRYFAAHQLKLGWAGGFVDRLQPFPDGLGEPVPVEPDAETLLLWAALDELAPEAGADFDAKLAGWSKGAPTLQQIAGKLSTAEAAISEQSEWNSGLWNVIAGISVRRFRGDALDMWFGLPRRNRRILGSLIKGLTWLASEDTMARRRIASWFTTPEQLGFYRREWEPLAAALGVAPVADEKRAKPADGNKDREPIPPPPELAMPTTWDALAAAWSLVRRPPGAGDPKVGDATAVAEQLGIPAVPPSYLEYLRRFYALGELRKKYQRDRFPTYLDLMRPDRLVRERDIFDESLASIRDISVEWRETARALKGLLPFGSDTSRTNICWDPTRTNDAGEMLICFVDGDKSRIDEARTDIGYDLKEVLKYYKPGSLRDLD